MTDKTKPPAPAPESGAADATPQSSSDQQAHRLKHLLHLANDLCLSYRTAIRRVEDAELREELVEMDQSHDRLRARLGALLETMGHTPVGSGDLHGLLERGRVVVGGWQGDDGILRAMANNEREMSAALREERHIGDLPAEAIEIVDEALDHEDAHKQYYDHALRIFVG